MLERCVAIYNDSKNIIGTGFFVEENTLVTCSHVCASSDKIFINFDSVFFELEIIKDNKEKDISLLNVLSNKKTYKTVILGASSGYIGERFYTYGFSKIDNIQGINASGKILGLLNGGRIQLKSQEISKGMSGAPIFENVNNTVIGVVSSFYSPKEKSFKMRDAVFGVSSKEIKEMFPSVNISSRVNFLKNRIKNILVENIDEVNKIDSTYKVKDVFVQRKVGIENQTMSISGYNGLIDSEENHVNLIIGSPGSGKSTILKYLYMNILLEGKSSRLPLFFDFEEVNSDNKRNWSVSKFYKYITNYLETILNDSIKESVNSLDLIIFLDGLDQLQPSNKFIEKILNSINIISDKHNISFILSSREMTNKSISLDNIKKIQLFPLDKNGIIDFIGKYRGNILGVTIPNNLYSFLSTPLYLYFLIEIYKGKSPPDTVPLLIADVIKMRLEYEDIYEEYNINMLGNIKLLCDLSMVLYANNGSLVLADIIENLSYSSNRPVNNIEDLLNCWKTHQIISISSNKLITFWHREFLTYFVALNSLDKLNTELKRNPEKNTPKNAAKELLKNKDKYPKFAVSISMIETIKRIDLIKIFITVNNCTKNSRLISNIIKLGGNSTQSKRFINISEKIFYEKSKDFYFILFPYLMAILTLMYFLDQLTYEYTPKKLIEYTENIKIELVAILFLLSFSSLELIRMKFNKFRFNKYLKEISFSIHNIGTAEALHSLDNISKEIKKIIYQVGARWASLHTLSASDFDTDDMPENIVFIENKIDEFERKGFSTKNRDYIERKNFLPSLEALIKNKKYFFAQSLELLIKLYKNNYEKDKINKIIFSAIEKKVGHSRIIHLRLANKLAKKYKINPSDVGIKKISIFKYYNYILKYFIINSYRNFTRISIWIIFLLTVVSIFLVFSDFYEELMFWLRYL